MPLDIRRVVKAGVLAAGRTARWYWTLNDYDYASIQIRAELGHVVLSYLYRPRGGDAEDVTQRVEVVTTPGTLGGRRPWFACPRCGRRVAVIYGAGRLFACRQCKGLAYASQKETADDRAARRADRIRNRLGWEIGILNPPGGKPKGMHWKTFERFMARHDALVMMSLNGMTCRLRLLERSLESLDEDLAKLR